MNVFMQQHEVDPNIISIIVLMGTVAQNLDIIFYQYRPLPSVYATQKSYGIDIDRTTREESCIFAILTSTIFTLAYQ